MNQDTTQTAASGTTEEKLFYALLQLGIGTRNSLEIPIPTPETSWKKVMVTASKQAVIGIVMDGVLRLPKGIQPPEAIKWKGMQLLIQIEQLNRRVNGEAVEVSKFLQQEGYRCTLLKGQGIARYYPNPMHRMPGDIDIWPDAEPDELRKYGYQKFPDPEWSMHHTHIPLLKETQVELHFQPSYMFNPLTNRRLLTFCRKHRKACTANRVTLEGTNEETAIATDTFNRVYVLQHIMRHLLGEGIGMRQLTDYCLILRKGTTTAEKEETMQILTQLNMKGFTEATMYVLQTVFALEEKYLLCQPDIAKGKLLLNEILEGGNFGFFDERGNKRTLINKVKKRWNRFRRLISLAPTEVTWSFLFFTMAFFRRRLFRLTSKIE